VYVTTANLKQLLLSTLIELFYTLPEWQITVSFFAAFLLCFLQPNFAKKNNIVVVRKPT